VTIQNAPDGQPVISAGGGNPADRASCISLLVDRETERVAIVASAAGGMDIEEVAHATPEEVLTEICNPLLGVQDFQCRALAFALELTGEAYKDLCRLLPQLYRLLSNDLGLLEINPLVVTTVNRVLPLGCR
jgi:succinyl-CoA synthetase beta subunit